MTSKQEIELKASKLTNDALVQATKAAVGKRGSRYTRSHSQSRTNPNDASADDELASTKKKPRKTKEDPNTTDEGGEHDDDQDDAGNGNEADTDHAEGKSQGRRRGNRGNRGVGHRGGGGGGGGGGSSHRSSESTKVYYYYYYYYYY